MLERCSQLPTTGWDFLETDLDWASADLDLLNQMFGSFCSDYTTSTPSWDTINDYCDGWNWNVYFNLPTANKKKIFIITNEAQW